MSEIKFLAALAATLRGLDTLIFTICEGMEFLGIHLDSSRNDANLPSYPGRTVHCIVRVMRTDYVP